MARSLLALLLPLLLACQAGGELLMVYSVQRHGARNVLPKTATLKESDAAGGPTLLPEGQLQAYKVGVAYRERYMNPEGCGRNASLTGATCLEAELAEPGPEYGVVGSPDGLFNNFNTMVRSSSLDRTIMTARSFLDGAFPPINQPTATKYLPDGQQVVPVYALPEDGSGALIRSYTMCPAYDARLTDWYASDEFKAKEAETKPLRDTIAAAAPGLDTSLKNWWNVYDGFNVFRTYGVGTPMPTIPDATFDEMQQVAYWLETAKMRSELTGNLLGGLVLADLVRYLDAAEAATASNDVELIYYKMLHLSGHYNTQLGLLGALQIDQDPATANFTWFKKIPSLAAVMAFELHSDPSTRPADLAVRLVMQDGAGKPYTTIPLPCASAGDSAEALAGPGACSLDAFRALAEPLAFNTTGDWCTACGNTKMSTCQLQQAAQNITQLEARLSGSSTSDGSSSSSGSSSGSGLSGGAVAGIAVGCAAAVAALLSAAFFVYHRKVTAQLKQAHLADTYGNSVPFAA
ncbi:acid phosphatase [Chlorella sorokiniana]|uniref:Acid phosphatase n=1 Tax=Chlorella sorokiniana TaxID=3076 RepID=A0A2P6TB43_CHLSO|nr:acid phosphatase [Chlorella sorokiniana]|eukprot:PRW05761.1 acid phosphatase [Chlorella sorokiniana]